MSRQTCCIVFMRIGRQVFVVAEVKAPQMEQSVQQMCAAESKGNDLGTQCKRGNICKPAQNFRPPYSLLAGYKEVRPMVFCGMFPSDADQFDDFREALGRLQLNDAALMYEPEVQKLFFSEEEI